MKTQEIKLYYSQMWDSEEKSNESIYTFRKKEAFTKSDLFDDFVTGHTEVYTLSPSVFLGFQDAVKEINGYETSSEVSKIEVIDFLTENQDLHKLIFDKIKKAKDYNEKIDHKKWWAFDTETSGEKEAYWN